MDATASVRAVTFDFGQTLAELDTAMLAARLGERGVAAEPARLDAAIDDAVRAYSRAIAAGFGGHPWKLLMRHLLEQAGVRADAIDPSVDWLWDEQPSRNLWRRPIPGMIELARELAASGIPVGVVSNSEGKLFELAVELGWGDVWSAFADSGKLGLEKPGRAIFDWTAARLGVPIERIVHVGDALAADVEGALSAGMMAIWFRGDRSSEARLGPRARVASDAAGVRAALASLGLPRALAS